MSQDRKKKSTRRIGRGALTAFVGLGVVAAGLPAAMQATAAPVGAEAAAAAGNTIKVVQHNTDQIEARWIRVLGKGDSNDLLLAEEVCQKWVEDARVAHAGWKFSFHRQKRTTEDNALNVCPASADGSTWKGPVAVYTGDGASTTQDKLLDKSDGQRFGMACVTFTHAGRKVHGCATHLQVYHDKNLADRTRQTAAIKRITTPWIQQKGHSVIVGGDFNMTPTRSPMSSLYQSRGSGRFIEANQLKTGSGARAGDPTVFNKAGEGQRKIDYVFFSSNRTPLGSGGTLTVTPIDEAHGILAATAHIR